MWVRHFEGLLNGSDLLNPPRIKATHIVRYGGNSKDIQRFLEKDLGRGISTNRLERSTSSRYQRREVLQSATTLDSLLLSVPGGVLLEKRRVQKKLNFGINKLGYV